MGATIYLVRHGIHAEVGKVLSGRSQIPLDARGQDQALAIARRFGTVPLASLHTSPLARARQTIAPLAAASGLPVTVAAALDEIDFGAFTGRSFINLEGDADWDRWNAARNSARCPGGETMAEAIGRALGYLRAITPADRPALCVTHCDIIRGVAASLLGRPFDSLFELPCEPASVTRLHVDGDRWRVELPG